MATSWKSLLAFWKRPAILGVDVDSPRMVEIHREIISSDPMFLYIHERRYGQLFSSVEATKRLRGPIVEIGCGPGYIEKYLPEVVKTDILPHSGVHLVCDAGRLPFPDRSVRAVFIVGVLHHLQEPGRFLAEAQRCLQDGARLVLIEPSNSWPQRFLTGKFSIIGEFSDSTVMEWRNETNGPLTNANIALPWVIFVRDRKKFEKRFPGLRILDVRWHLWIAFYLSGGMTYRSFVPSFLLPVVRGLERFGQPLSRWLGTDMIVEIEKR